MTNALVVVTNRPRRQKSKNYKKGIYCPHCFNMTTPLQKKSFEERHKQIELAKKKGIKHLGT